MEKEYAESCKKLEQYKNKAQRLENRRSYYDKGNRKKRTHRLITRGAAVESIAPQIKNMSERDFYILMEKVFSLPVVFDMINDAVAEDKI